MVSIQFIGSILLHATIYCGNCKYFFFEMTVFLRRFFMARVVGPAAADVIKCMPILIREKF